MALTMMPAFSEPVPSAVTQESSLRQAAQGCDAGQGGVRCQRLYNSQAVSGHRHFWFVPHRFFLKFEFVASLQPPGDFA